MLMSAYLKENFESQLMIRNVSVGWVQNCIHRRPCISRTEKDPTLIPAAPILQALLRIWYYTAA